MRQKIAVLGANGQVGAELCLILSNHPEVELVPVCRNRGGSAFLRYYGIPCRHGLPGDPAQAPALFGDCDVIVNAALGHGTPSQIRAAERDLIVNSLAVSGPRAKIVYFSTQMVHGDPRPGAWVRWRGAYGRAKLRSERLLRSGGQSSGKETYILRLGHVCGELQNIARKIRNEIRTGPVVLPAGESPSNVVYTATVADAVLRIAAGKEAPGTYDLMCHPEWSWRQVYAYEAERCGLPFEPVYVPLRPPGRRAGLASLGGALLSLVKRAAGRPLLKQATLRMLALAPTAWNELLHAMWYEARARAEIRQLFPSAPLEEALTWVRMGRTFLSSLAPTRDLVDQPLFRIPPRDPALAWPADLPLYLHPGGKEEPVACQEV